MSRGLRVRMTVGAGIAACTAAFALPTVASATTYNISTTQSAPDGVCGVAEAIVASNTDAPFGDCQAGSGSDTINLTANGTIELNAELFVNSNIDINGPGENLLNLHRSTSSDFRIFTFGASSNSQLSGVTVSNGSTANGLGGGGITNQGTLDLSHVIVTGNRVEVSAGGGLTPSANGGGISNSGTLSISDSTITSNSATAVQTEPTGTSLSALARGGGIISGGANLTVTRSTVSGNVAIATVSSPDPSNQAQAQGGGIAQTGGFATIRESTIAANATQGNSEGSILTTGGGIYANGATLTLTSDTIANNGALMGASLAANSNEGVTNTIMFSDSVQPNCQGSINADGGHNLTYPDTCTGISALVADPKLRTLNDYGGPTKTMALGADSPAIDHGATSGSVTDQRGESRVFDFPSIANDFDGADIGAFEAQDADGDGVNDQADACPNTSSTDPSGCPAADRTLALKYKKGAKKFKGKISSLAVPACGSGQEVTILRKAKGPDVEVGTTVSFNSGSYGLEKKAKPGTYYSTVSDSLIPGVANCLAAKSPSLKVKR